MDCKTASEYIMKYFDNELNCEEKTKLYKHIENCNDCKMEFDSLKYVIENINDIGLEEAPLNLEENILVKIKEQDSKNESKVKKRKIIYISIAIAGLWSLLLYLLFFTPLFKEVLNSFDVFRYIFSKMLFYIIIIINTAFYRASELVAFSFELKRYVTPFIQLLNALALLLIAVMIIFSNIITGINKSLGGKS